MKKIIVIGGAGFIGSAVIRHLIKQSNHIVINLDSPRLFTENTPYAPSSPYSASKASEDHLDRAWFRTYGLPVVVTNCSNNYGPYQFPEKLIPLTILNALKGIPILIYGKGNQVWDWLYVEDNVRALCMVAMEGTRGETYNIGGHNETQNLEVVQRICELLEELAAGNLKGVMHYLNLIRFVHDRPGHDRSYSIDASKTRAELSWIPREMFENGLRKTVEWHLENQAWCEHVQDGSYLRKQPGVGV